MSLTCSSCGAPADDRGALDEFLASASDIQRYQIANRLRISEEAINDAPLCADCVTAAVQWANVD